MSVLILYAMMLLGTTPEGWTLYHEQHRGIDAYVFQQGDERETKVAPECFTKKGIPHDQQRQPRARRSRQANRRGR